MMSSLCPLISYILSEAVNYIRTLDNTQGLTNMNASQAMYDIAKILLPNAMTLRNIQMTLPIEDFFVLENMLMNGFVNHVDMQSNVALVRMQNSCKPYPAC
jgi:hypothetical protein